MASAAHEHDLHQRRGDRRRLSVVGRHRRRGARALIDWRGHDVAQGLEREGGAPELALHRAGEAVPVDLAAVGGPAGRADLGDHLRRPPRAHRAAGLRGVRLEARRLRRRDGGVGDHRGAERRRRRGAPRSDGDAAVLRLQHGRLLRPLAADGHAASRSRRRSSTSTGSGRTTRAGSSGRASARTCASLRWIIDALQRQRQRQRGRVADRPAAGQGRASTPPGSTSKPGAMDELLTVIEGRLAQGSRQHRRVLRQVRRSPAEGDEQAARRAGEATRVGNLLIC